MSDRPAPRTCAGRAMVRAREISRQNPGAEVRVVPDSAHPPFGRRHYHITVNNRIVAMIPCINRQATAREAEGELPGTRAAADLEAILQHVDRAIDRGLRGEASGAAGEAEAMYVRRGPPIGALTRRSSAGSSVPRRPATRGGPLPPRVRAIPADQRAARAHQIAQVSQQIQQSAAELARRLEVHHAGFRGTYEAAIAEAQGATMYDPSGQIFSHIDSMRQGAQAINTQLQAVTAGLNRLSRLDRNAGHRAQSGLQQLLQRARQMVGLAREVERLVAGLRNQYSSRLGLAPVGSGGRTEGNLISTQLQRAGLDLLPPELQPRTQALIAQIKRVPVNEQQARAVLVGELDKANQALAQLQGWG
jgi:hypothetical protein